MFNRFRVILPHQGGQVKFSCNVERKSTFQGFFFRKYYLVKQENLD